MDRPLARRRVVAAVLALCVTALGGCRTFHGWAIDPSGQGLITNRAPEKFKAEPGLLCPRYDAYVTLCPQKIVAPVGAEVVVLAGVCGLDGKLLSDQQVEWMLPPGGVGTFVTTGQRTHLNQLTGWLHGDAAARKVDNTYLVSRTSGKYITLTRGTPEPSDDVSVLRGQAWTSVSSPIEGTSYVTAFAPEVYGWDSRQRTATIDWVDARWTLPPPAINPVGSRHTLTTSVVRQTNSSPVIGWRVRYEITGGPSAALAVGGATTPDGSQVVEVPTNEIGQASVDIFQLQPSPGTNTIAVQVFRPAGINGVGDRLLIAAGGTTKTWTGEDLSIRVQGPAEAGVGSTVNYRLEVNNPAQIEARDCVVSFTVPPGLTLVGTTPPAQPVAGALEWRIGNLGPGQVQVLDLSLRVDREGVFNNCAAVRTAEGRTAQNCLATTVVSGALEVAVVGPQQALVGEPVTFEVTLTNRSNAPATNLLLVDAFDAGLVHEISAGRIERDLADLAAGETRRVPVTFRAARPGRQCNRVEVRSGGGLRGSAEACLMVYEAQRGQPAQLSVRKSGPTRVAVGEKALFNIDVTNTGSVPATGIKVADNYDPSLNPTAASTGRTVVGANLIWQVPVLEPGQTIRLQVECQCIQPASRACNRVTVTAEGGGRSDSEACLEIVSAPAALDVQVSDLRDFVAVGKELTYEILVRNVGATSDNMVSVVATASQQMTPLPIGTGVAGGLVRFNIDGQSVRFEPVAEVRAGETLRFRVVVRANLVGDARLRVEVRSARAAAPIVQEESTSIVAGER